MKENALVETNRGALMTSDSIFFDVAKFEHSQRIAKVFSDSTMVPEHYRNNIGNCMIAIDMAQRINADIFMVMQSLYVVGGRPGMEGKLVISLINRCGRFEPLEFIEEGNLSKPEKETDGCYVLTKEIKTGRTIKGPMVDWAMVKKDGWYDKKSKTGAYISKWRTIAPLMFRYRAAAFFGRTHCPEVLLGMQTKEELEDIITLQQTWPGTYEATTDDSDKGHAPDLSNRDTSLYDGRTALENKKTVETPPARVESQQAPAPGEEEEQKPTPDEAEKQTQNETAEPNTQAWDPLEEAPLGRYTPEKADAVKAAAKNMRVSFAKSWTPGRIHALIKAKQAELSNPPAGADDNANQPTPRTPQAEAPANPNESQPARRAPEITDEDRFGELVETSLVEWEKRLINDYFLHCINTVNTDREEFIRGALQKPREFIAAFRGWLDHQDDLSENIDPERSELLRRAQISELDNPQRWEAIVRAAVKSGTLPGTDKSEWSTDQLRNMTNAQSQF